VRKPAIWKARQILVKKLKARVTSDSARRSLVNLETKYEMARNIAALAVPSLITPSPKFLTIAITAKCNLRCEGCLYGRGYMNGSELPTEMVLSVLRDAAAAGMSTVRLYGGEPLLHTGLPDMIRECVALGLSPFVTTNGIILKRRLDAIVDAGLRTIEFGYYGHGEEYDSYVGKKGAWDRFEAAVADARDRHRSDLRLRMSYVLNTRTCSVAELRKAWEFAIRYDLSFKVDLVHYSLPYFTEGPNRELQFKPADVEQINQVVAELAILNRERPDLYKEPHASIRSIPDWLLRGADMRVPCDAYNMIWVGADGSVRLCYVTFPMGNLFDKPLREMLFTASHKSACVSANQLACPNCHCSRDTRIEKHLPSLLRYSVGQTKPLPPVDKPGPFVMVR